MDALIEEYLIQVEVGYISFHGLQRTKGSESRLYEI